MEKYLVEISKMLEILHTFSTVKVVMGNETCDLDSCISALIYAYLLHKELNKEEKATVAVIPLLNIFQKELPVRTEVTFFLARNGIPMDLLVFRDSIHLDELHKAGKLKLILVDHHVLSLETQNLHTSVVEIIDHRPRDPACCWLEEILTLKKVGSCCTLVGDKVLQRLPQLINRETAMMLYGPIVLDTACFSPAADRTTELDLKIVAELEARGVDSAIKEKLFTELLAARADISSLTPSQLLVKDLKIAAGIPVPGLPILVQEFVTRPNVASALNEFCSERKTNIIVVMGLHIEGESIQRDIAVFHTTAPHVAQKLSERLKGNTDPVLLLEDVDCTSYQIPGLQLYKQLNVKASRKQILPIIRGAADFLSELQ